MKPLTIGSLFAGIGGFDLAAEAMGWDTLWFVEWDAACRCWLGVNFPGRPIYGDITTVDFTEVEPVDVLCGGFPCQPSSAAGKRLGTADDRWLWPEFARAIGEIRPRYVVAENVPGLLSVNGGRAFAEVLRDLAALGYDAEWDRLSAGDVGSPQERERVWIVAYANREVRSADERESDTRANRRHDIEGRGPRLGDSNGAPSRRDRVAVPRAENGSEGPRRRTRRLADRPWDASFAVRGHDGTLRLIPESAAALGPESPLWPVATRVPDRVARLRAIGNAVVPQCVVEGPFQVILERERSGVQGAS